MFSNNSIIHQMCNIKCDKTNKQTTKNISYTINPKIQKCSVCGYYGGP